jgi:predicted Rossmann fold flavoprotein
MCQPPAGVQFFLSLVCKNRWPGIPEQDAGDIRDSPLRSACAGASGADVLRIYLNSCILRKTDVDMAWYPITVDTKPRNTVRDEVSDHPGGWISGRKLSAAPAENILVKIFSWQRWGDWGGRTTGRRMKPSSRVFPCGAESSNQDDAMDIAIIGAGPSGMAAALEAAWSGAAATLYERNSLVGRKLLVTGSGRCNLTNDSVAPEQYACADPEWIGAFLESFGVQEIIRLLRKIGIPVYKTSDGWYYPLSNSAQSVTDAFHQALIQAGVTIRTKHHVTGIRTAEKGFLITLTDAFGKTRELVFSKVIVAAGGAAQPKLGSRGELFPELEKMGHTVLPQRPALAPVQADLQSLIHLQGLKLDAGVELLDGDERAAESEGNILFTEWGINGPGVMNLSHVISARPNHSLTLSLDLLHFFEKEFSDLLREKRESGTPVRIFLEAFFPPKAASLFPAMARVPEDALLGSLDDESLQRLIRTLRATRVKVRGVRGFEVCQLSAGGVPVTEADPRTLESRIVKGVYLAGETLDAVGPCGGFNLHFSFAGGVLAGRAAAKKIHS